MFKIDASTPKIIISSTSRTNQKGLHQIINHCRIGSRRMTEVVTHFQDGKKGIREIYYDIIGANPEKIVDKMEGRVEIYTSGAPERPYDVIQEIEGMKCYLPNLTLEKLAGDF